MVARRRAAGAVIALGALAAASCGPEPTPVIAPAPTASTTATVSQTATTTALAATPPPFEPPPTCSADGYCWESPNPVADVFTEVFAFSGRNVYTLSESHMAHFDGATWKAERLPVPVDADPQGEALFAHLWASATQPAQTTDPNTRVDGFGAQSAKLGSVWAANASAVYTAGAGGKIARFDGKTWSAETSGTTADLAAVFGVNTDQVYTVGTLNDVGVVLRRDASGWKPMPSVGTSLSGVWANSKGDVWVAGTNERNALSVWQWSGTQWNALTEFSDAMPIGFWGNSTGLTLLGFQFADKERRNFGPADVLLFSNASGRWERKYVYTQANNVIGSANRWTLSGSGDGTVYIAGGWGLFGKITSAGFQDLLGNVSPTKNLHAVCGTSPTDVYAAGNGVLLHYDGKSWSADPAGKDLNVTNMAGSKDLIVAAAPKGKLFFRRDGAWKTISTGTKKDLYAVWIQGDEVFAGGADGTIVRCKNDKCAPMKTPTTEGIFAIAATAAGGVYAVDAQATLLRFDGKSWVMEPTPGYPNVKVVNPENDNKPPYHEGVLYISAIYPAPKSGMLVERTDGSWHFDNGTWTLVGHGGTLALSGRPGGDVYAAYGGQFVQPPLRIRRFDGEKWREESLPTRAFDSAGLSIRDIAVVGEDVFLVGDAGAIIHRKAPAR
ncbi:MAG: hypothetical protein IPK82_36190 [Polyangiaceae bacterium]|nr:hypothetical protein [Polyangiaceae bacterium]